jgi:hypothetical protein
MKIGGSCREALAHGFRIWVPALGSLLQRAFSRVAVHVIAEPPPVIEPSTLALQAGEYVLCSLARCFVG